MSLIFDALQRSEAARSGVDVSALSAATDVLRLAELHATSEKETAVEAQQPDTTEPGVTEPAITAPGITGRPKHDAPLPRKAAPPPTTAVDNPVAAETSRQDKQSDTFPQFQSIDISVPLQNRLVCHTDNESLAAEKFRFLGVRLQHLRREQPLKKVLITSTIPQEGKSTVSANLACTLARRTQQRTLLVEGDVRRPALSQMFGLARMPGICEALQDDRSLTTSIYYLKEAGLWILPAGITSRNPLELLQSGRLPTMMDQLTAWFDWIVIDSPPLLPLADTSVLMRLADGILLVAREGITEKRQLQRGLEALEPRKLIGAVLNGSRGPTRNDYYYTPVKP